MRHMYISTKIIWLVITTVDYLKFLRKVFQLISLPPSFFLDQVFRNMKPGRITLTGVNSMPFYFKSSLLSSGDRQTFNLRLFAKVKNC